MPQRSRRNNYPDKNGDKSMGDKKETATE